jgi:ribosomal protein S18 acetylase RimI-like enzyme
VEEKGEVRGVLLAIPEWSDWRNGTVLWIHSLYVVPEARGQGVFKKLYLNLKEQVEKSPELVGLRLYVDKKNKSAQKIYEKLGMSRDHYELYEWLK